MRNTKTKSLKDVTITELTGKEPFVTSSSWNERKHKKLAGLKVKKGLKKELSVIEHSLHSPGSSEDARPGAMEAWTRSALARVYPAGHRIKSDNYDPSDAWATGCQIVALNMQVTPEDNPLYTNWGFFLRKGGCGYVPKPQFLRESSFDELDEYARFEDAVPADQADAESKFEECPGLDEGLGHGGGARRLLRGQYCGRAKTR